MVPFLLYMNFYIIFISPSTIYMFNSSCISITMIASLFCDMSADTAETDYVGVTDQYACNTCVYHTISVYTLSMTKTSYAKCNSS